ncbi:MAG: four helix bundle protein [Bacteroidales bacterium]|jgi:four helix bundle protein|nr:four helix bundle protein [Bacteroidales bacterium]
MERIAFIEGFKKRTKLFAPRIIRLYQSLPKSGEAQVLGKQLLRSAISVAANYRAVCRARTKAEFVSKMGVVVEEADESVFWIELLIEANIVKGEKLKELIDEANEILSIVSAARKSASIKDSLK